jgi:hypothetical protein
MISEGEQIALFNAPTRVLKAERVLRQAGLACRLIPAPREVAEGCALALRFAAADREAIFRELAGQGLLPRRLFGKQQGVLIPLELTTKD